MFLPVQKGAIKALTQDQSCVEKTRNAYKHRRDLLVNGCQSIGWDIDMPKGTMFVWAKIPDKFKDSETFVKELFDKTKLPTLISEFENRYHFKIYNINDLLSRPIRKENLNAETKI